MGETKASTVTNPSQAINEGNHTKSSHNVNKTKTTKAATRRIQHKTDNASEVFETVFLLIMVVPSVFLLFITIVSPDPLSSIRGLFNAFSPSWNGNSFHQQQYYKVYDYSTVADASDEKKPVTNNSAIKITHLQSGAGHYYLRSQQKMNWRNSKSQVVTFSPPPSSATAGTDSNQFWLVQHTASKTVGDVIKCGDEVQLRHMNSNALLYMVGDDKHPRNNNNFFIKLNPSGLQVTAETEEVVVNRSNTNELYTKFEVKCKSKTWNRDEPFELWNVGNQRYLAADTGFHYDRTNCGRQCPMMNHLEVHGVPTRRGTTLQVTYGIHFARA